MRRRTLLALTIPAIAAIAFGAVAQLRVDQKDRAFSPDAIVIGVGDTVQIANGDPFLHQLYVSASAFTFDSDEQPPGEIIRIRFPVTGTFDVRCRIHPTMRLRVTVR